MTQTALTPVTLLYPCNVSISLMTRLTNFWEFTLIRNSILKNIFQSFQLNFPELCSFFDQQKIFLTKELLNLCTMQLSTQISSIQFKFIVVPTKTTYSHFLLNKKLQSGLLTTLGIMIIVNLSLKP